MFRNLSSFSNMESGDVWHPPTDVYETDENFVIKVDLAGIQKENINVYFQKNEITIRGVRQKNNEEEGITYHNMEIPSGPFKRQVKLPRDYTIDNYKAKYEDGFLIIRLTKGQREKSIKNIEIK